LPSFAIICHHLPSFAIIRHHAPIVEKRGERRCFRRQQSRIQTDVSSFCIIHEASGTGLKTALPDFSSMKEDAVFTDAFSHDWTSIVV